ncbi:MAG: alpha-ketoglutarate-dependent dioxygenase AlkB [Pseudomonadota bacterium]
MKLPEKHVLGGVEVYPGFLDRPAQEAVLSDLAGVMAAAPLREMKMPNGRPLSVRMTAAGSFGWTIDRSGYSYAPHQSDGKPWPMIPAALKEMWSALVPASRPPESVLINHYGPGARMGLHQDRDEADFSQPVVSLSLGDDGLFRVGGLARRARTQSVWLNSGDALVMQGDARLVFHGVDRIRSGSSTLLPDGGRLNVTMRVVT